MEMLLSPFGEEKKKKRFKTKKHPVPQERQPESCEKTALHEGPNVNEGPKSSLVKNTVLFKTSFAAFCSTALADRGLGRTGDPVLTFQNVFKTVSV